MKRNIILLVVLLLFAGGGWYYYNWVYPKYPTQIRNDDRTIQLRDEKLISAQIIHQELAFVSNLIEKNIAISKSDSLAEDASLPFLEYITGILNDLEIKLEKLEPGRRSARLDYVRTPYTLTMQASYQMLGQFVNRLEKSERLITVEEFEIDNAVRKSGATARKGVDPRMHPVTMKISTLTLIKQR